MTTLFRNRDNINSIIPISEVRLVSYMYGPEGGPGGNQSPFLRINGNTFRVPDSERFQGMIVNQYSNDNGETWINIPGNPGSAGGRLIPDYIWWRNTFTTDYYKQEEPIDVTGVLIAARISNIISVSRDDITVDIDNQGILRYINMPNIPKNTQINLINSFYNKTFVQTTEPTSMRQGDLWINPETNELYYFNGGN